MAQIRKVHHHRYTSLDRFIKRDTEKGANAESPFFTVASDPKRAGLGRKIPLLDHTAERVESLHLMGLAEHSGPNSWSIQQEFENIPRAMQRSSDRQKMLAAHGVLIFDEQLPLSVLDFRRLSTLEGRILVNGRRTLGTRSAAVTSCSREQTDRSSASTTRPNSMPHVAAEASGAS